MYKIPIILFCLLSILTDVTPPDEMRRHNEWWQSAAIHYGDDTMLFRCHLLVITRHSLSCLGAGGDCVVKISWKQSLCDMIRLLKYCLVSIKRFSSKIYLHLSLAVEYFMFADRHHLPILMMGQGLFIFGNLSASQQSEPVSCSDH